MKTYTPKAPEIQRRWWLVDADGQVLGRVASQVAQLLRGKHKPMFTPHLDTGDFVVVVNAAKVRLTGSKPESKAYFRHSGYMGGEKFIPFRTMMERHPELHEGELSVTRSQVVSEPALSDVARELALGDWLLLGRGEERSGGRVKPSLLAEISKG